MLLLLLHVDRVHFPTIREITHIKTNKCRIKARMCKDLLTIYTYILASKFHIFSIVLLFVGFFFLLLLFLLVFDVVFCFVFLIFCFVFAFLIFYFLHPVLIVNFLNK